METDEEVYLRYVNEDNDADLETLLIRHRDGLLLFLLGFVRNTEDAEDLLMDTFAKLALDKPDFEPERIGSFKSWLYTIARRNALMHIRKRKSENRKTPYHFVFMVRSSFLPIRLRQCSF